MYSWYKVESIQWYRWWAWKNCPAANTTTITPAPMGRKCHIASNVRLMTADHDASTA